MANLEAVTASNGATIKQDKKVELKAYLKRYGIGDDAVTVDIEGDSLVLYGYGFLYVYPLADDGTDSGVDATEEFLQGLAPYLAEPLIVQVILHEKCRFPLGAWEVKVHPDGRVEYNRFKFD